MGLYQNETENYHCDYKNITFTQNLNLMTFFFCYYFCISVFLFIFMGYERQELGQ